MKKIVKKIKNKYLRKNLKDNINKLSIDDFINKYDGNPFFEYEKINCNIYAFLFFIISSKIWIHFANRYAGTGN